MCVFRFSLWLVFCCRVEVMKGGYGFWFVGFVVMFVIFRLCDVMVDIVSIVFFFVVRLKCFSFLLLKMVRVVLY